MEYYLWFAAAVAFFILEIVVPGFVLLWFGVGAIAAGLLVLAGVDSVGIQILVFAAVSIVFVGLSRTIFKNIFMRSSPGAGLKTNMDAMIGKVGAVTEAIDNQGSVGRILVEGQDWSARTADDRLIPVGRKARIVSFDGAKLIVEEL